MALPRNEAAIAPKAHNKPEPVTVAGGQKQQSAIRRCDKSSGLTRDVLTAARLMMLRNVNTMDEYEEWNTRLWAYRKRKSMRRTERALARVHGTTDKREYALSKEEREEFSDGSSGSDTEPSQGKQSLGKSGKSGKCRYDDRCPCRGKEGAPCSNPLVELADKARLPPHQQPNGAYIARPNNSDLELVEPLPRSLVTDYRKHSNAYELRLATEALIGTLSYFEDVLPVEISIRIEAINNACDKEDDKQDDSTFDAFALFVLEWDGFPNLSDKVAHYLNGHVSFGGWAEQMKHVLQHSYGERFFKFDKARMANYTSLPKKYLHDNWPTYHWVVASWIAALAMHCNNYHQHRIRGLKLPADCVFPPTFLPEWARWQYREKWKGCTPATLREKNVKGTDV
ncbi:hypothetical protein CONLIGDRAFT_634600 [Coniochaeta ligniaria NRRL 30616]|uniref:Uncharacterized protein n=1 Tax=Coniochaeta ligniaria NRRL 30616 TaxID=1408157 RepID=A0A1J7J923_9PEZI|nr:hypothetical protein CONLIGDRAFT_634600 [Coniochaeta ligniaria NRRL 30616]